MKILYALHPGTVRSKTDGDIHYVNAQTLASLYGVDMRACMVAGVHLNDVPGLIHLWPRTSGNYSLPAPNA